MILDPSIKNKIEELFSRKPHTLADALGIEFLEIAPEKLVAKMPVDENTIQPFGLLHGGAIVSLAETLASIGGCIHVDTDKFNVMGIEINANHIRATTSGYVTGTATPIHLGRKTQVWETKIVNEEGKLISISRCTIAITEKSTRE